MRTLWQDARFGMRMLLKSPGFTAIAVLTLAVGIGANTAIFTVVYGVLLRPLPYPEPQRIVQLAESFRGQSEEMDLTAQQLAKLRESTNVFEHIAGYTDIGYNVTAGNQAEHVRGTPVSADYFQVLGVHPAVGRDFVPEEDRGDGQRVVILSHGLWNRQFGGDASAIGKSLQMNGESFTIIGVMPAEFSPRANSDINPGQPVELWVPLALVAKTAGSGENIPVIARLKRRVTARQLQTQMDLVTQDFRKAYPDDVPAKKSMSFLPYQYLMGADLRPYLLVLLGAIGFVLLIACANVANLLLARGASRTREVAVRTALGATRGRIVRQLMTESLLIALAGGGFGWLIAQSGLGLLISRAPMDLPRLNDIALDGWVFGFTCLVSVVTGILFGVAPAIYAVRTDLNETLKDSEGRSSAGSGRARIRHGLVVGEFALSLVLLTGAGLMLATFAKLINTNPGFDPHRVLTMRFWLNGSRYHSTTEVANFYRTVEEKLSGLPGVEGAGIVAAGLPLERGGNIGVQIEGTKEPEYLSWNYREASPNYFRAMGITLKQGRRILETDAAESTPVVVVNESLSKKYFAGKNPIGEHVNLNGKSREIVGIVADVKSFLDRPTAPTIFIPAGQASFEGSQLWEGWFPRNVVVRTSMKPAELSQAVRETVASVDPLVPTGTIQTMDEMMSKSVALRSFMMLLLSIFGALALILASVGLYGVIAFSVAQRTREIGVRMALGARPADVLRLVLNEGLALVAAGLVVGIGAALALTRLLAGMVYGVSLYDPLVFFAVNVLLVGISLMACYLPARRAMRVEPVVALRYE